MRLGWSLLEGDVVLQEISITGHGSYSAEAEKLTALKPINFIFGTNGAGKTTISRVINDPAAYAPCLVTWNEGRSLPCFVYSSDFVEQNFTTQLRGIFTLGESASDTLAKIEEAKSKIDEIQNALDQLNGTLGPEDGSSGKRGDKAKLRSAFEADCWRIKGKHDAYFKNVFTGVRNAATRFCDKLLDEVTHNKADLVDVEKLKRKAATLFEEGRERHPPIERIDMTDLIAVEREGVLGKKVVGKEDVDVAALIKRLGNSDWVRQGLPYLEQGMRCPFCQQEVTAELAARINGYFDETYLNDVAAISRICESYEVLADVVVTRLEEILASENRHIDAETLRAETDRLANRLAVNRRLLENKKREPSAPVALESLEELARLIADRIEAANLSIAEHNRLVENIVEERKSLVSHVWKCLLEENGEAIQAYLKAAEGIDKAIGGLSREIGEKQEESIRTKAELREIEKKVTSVQPTVMAINTLLVSFGFSGFHLRTAGDRDHLYEIVREDGRSANATLSEGEKSFVSFLYFYHLIRGSVSEADVTSDRIVVFDDPVSSLDSDVLFIVSALIKRVLKEAVEGTGQIKQVFVLTHNIYFHKEVSFDPKRNGAARAHETFWIVRKMDGISKIIGYPYNPIKTSYELLWTEVKSPNRSNMTIQNTLRRIVENYFKVLGNVDTGDIIAKFKGQDQQICASLFLWVNDGSHTAHDDLYISADQSIVDHYLDVFRRIFEETGQLGHYRMMMGPEEEQE